MSGSCPTLDSLVALGFELVPGGTAETVRYEFQNFELNASSVMWWTGQMVNLSGHGNTGRSLLVIDPGDLSSAKMIPNDLGNAEAAAWVSFILQPWRNELGPLPDWFIEGERHWELVPPAREQLAYKERQRAYEASPKCFIDRDYARPLRRNLVDEISLLDDDADEMTFSFDGRVLSIEVSGRLYEVLASGEGWQSSYKVAVSRGSKLPARFMSWRVEVLVMEGYLRFDRLSLGPCVAVSNGEYQ